MNTRILLFFYSSKVLEIFRNSKNIGSLPDATVVESTGNLTCSDLIKLYLKIKRVHGEDITENTANIAAISVLTNIVIDKKLKETWSTPWKGILDNLRGLLPIKYHCSALVANALKRTIRIYYKKINEQLKRLPKI